MIIARGLLIIAMGYVNFTHFLHSASWPAQSSDLNPIEDMWRLLKIRLNKYDTPPKRYE